MTVASAARKRAAHGARGARQPRAVADHLRRHDHPADGAVHRAVRHRPDRPEEVRRAGQTASHNGRGAGTAVLSRAAPGLAGMASPPQHWPSPDDADAAAAAEKRPARAAASPTAQARSAVEAEQIEQQLRPGAGATPCSSTQGDPGPGRHRRQRPGAVRPGLGDLRARGQAGARRHRAGAGQAARTPSPSRATPTTSRSHGAFPTNWELSTARATSVLRYLTDHQGLPAGHVSAAGYADQKPVATNATDGDQANRRVEIVILSDVGANGRVSQARPSRPRRRYRSYHGTQGTRPRTPRSGEDGQGRDDPAAVVVAGRPDRRRGAILGKKTSSGRALPRPRRAARPRGRRRRRRNAGQGRHAHAHHPQPRRRRATSRSGWPSARPRPPRRSAPPVARGATPPPTVKAGRPRPSTRPSSYFGALTYAELASPAAGTRPGRP